MKKSKITNRKEQIVYNVLKTLWPHDKIIHQHKLNIPYKYRKRWIKYKYIASPPSVIVKENYMIVDFLNESKNIVIEVDNLSHNSPNAKRKDKAQNKYLEKKGYKIIRIQYDIGFEEDIIQEKMQRIFSAIKGN